MRFIEGRSGRLAPVGVIALAFMLTACGGGSPDTAKNPGGAAKAGSSDLCRLITQSEARNVLGQPLAAGIPTSGQTPAGLSGGCKYLGTTVDPKTNTKGIVQVIILGTKLTRAQYDEISTSEGKIGAEAGAKPVAGLGETAFHVPGLITLFDRGLSMSVQVVRTDRTFPSVEEMTRLARQALDRAGDLR